MTWEALTPREWLIISVAALVALLLFRAWIRRWWTDRSRARATARRFRKGAEGELLAESILEQCGYTIVERQYPGSWVLIVGEEAQTVRVYADFLVEDSDGCRFIAEAKTGDVAANVGRAATRRQLLEYHHVFDVDGICLIDVEAEEIYSVDFSSGAMPVGGSGSDAGLKLSETELTQ